VYPGSGSRLSSAPRPWFKLDRTFLTRGSIETLADQFGPAGPLAIIALVCEAASTQGGGKREEFEVIEWRFGFLGRRIRVDAATATAIVRAAAAVGLVELLMDDGERFKLRLLRWKDWHPKDPLAAERQQRHRSKDGLV
jgi:hypothetical protein